jgi:hypothetical protein
MEIQKTQEAWKKIILIFGCILIINIVYAAPPIPNTFIGNVTIDGQPAPIGTQINIYVDSVFESSYNITEIGKYNLHVKTGNESNLPVEFKILNKTAGTSTRTNGDTIYLDLAITTTETSTDSSESSSSSSGGGGGGGGPSGGGSSGNSVLNTPVTSLQSDNSETETGTENQETENSEDFSPSITGRVTNFLESGKNITIVGALVIIIIGVMLIKFKPQRWRKN